MNAEDIALPELTDQRIDEIETALFAQIAASRRDELDDARRARTRAVRRGRIWMGAAAAAALVSIAPAAANAAVLIRQFIDRSMQTQPLSGAVELSNDGERASRRPALALGAPINAL